MDAVPMLVCQNLELNVSRVLHVSLQVDCSVTKGSLGFLCGCSEKGQIFVFVFCQSHSSTSSSCCGLDHYGEANLHPTSLWTRRLLAAWHEPSQLGRSEQIEIRETEKTDFPIVWDWNGILQFRRDAQIQIIQDELSFSIENSQKGWYFESVQRVYDKKTCTRNRGPGSISAGERDFASYWTELAWNIRMTSYLFHIFQSLCLILDKSLTSRNCRNTCCLQHFCMLFQKSLHLLYTWSVVNLQWTFIQAWKPEFHRVWNLSHLHGVSGCWFVSHGSDLVRLGPNELNVVVGTNIHKGGILW